MKNPNIDEEKRNAESYKQEGDDAYSKDDLKKAIDCYKKSVDGFKREGNEKGEANALNLLGSVYKDKGELNLAIEYYEKALEIFPGDKREKAGICRNIGKVYQGKGEWNKAIEYYEKALEAVEGSEYVREKAEIKGDFGWIHYSKGEWNKAIEYYKEALKIFKKIDDIRGKAGIYKNIGIVYQDKGEWTKAIECYEKAFEICDKLGDMQSKASVLNEIGKLQIKTGDWYESKINLEESLEISKRLAPIQTTDARTNLGDLLRIEDQYAGARENLDKALVIVEGVGALPKKIEILEKKGNIYLSEYDKTSQQEDLKSAKSNYDSALKLAIELTLSKAIALRNIGIVRSKKKEIDPSRKLFEESIDILERLGARYELTKTIMDFARALKENEKIPEAKKIAERVALDAKGYDFNELQVKAYMLLGDIVQQQDASEYRYYLEALNTSSFNFKIYIRI